MTIVFVVICASTLYACVFSVFAIFAHCAFGDHFLRREEDIKIQDKVDVSKNSISTDDEYESDDEEDGYMSSESLSGMESRSPLHEDDASQSGSSASYWETDLSELCETHQHIESDDTCDMHQDNISGPIDDDMGIVTSVHS